MHAKLSSRQRVNIYLIEIPFNPFANREGKDQAALVRAA